MFLRLLFVLLIVLNIVAGAWLVLGQPYEHVLPATDEGVHELRLLSEMPASAISTTAPASATSAPANAGTAAAAPTQATAPTQPDRLQCLTLGPFATPHDLQSARGALSTQASRMRSREEQTTQSHGWWVYLPAVGNRAQAIALTHQLAAHHITDYFVVGSSGQPNSISLGLFMDEANAHKRRDEVAAAGFPARITERTESVPQYWLDLVVPNGARFDWHSHIRDAGVGSHSTACF